jgi:hypothetical protein
LHNGKDILNVEKWSCPNKKGKSRAIDTKMGIGGDKINGYDE